MLIGEGTFWALMMPVIVVWLAFGMSQIRSAGGQSYLSLSTEYAVFLIGGGVLAQLGVHIFPEVYHAVVHVSVMGFDVHFAINEVFMTLFFAVAGAELVEAVLIPGGTLYRAKAILPFAGCLGGVIGPKLVYHLLCTDDMHGMWPTSIATDIAIAWVLARIFLGPKHPGTIFALGLAIVDDFIGMGVIAWYFPQRPVLVMGFFVLFLAMGLAWYMGRLATKGVELFNRWWVYLLPGAISWYGLYTAGLHPALAMVFIVPFMPRASHDAGLFDEEEEHETDALNAFSHAVKMPVDVGLFFFAFVNAGVAWIGYNLADQNTFAVFTALGVGKTLFVFGATAATYYTLRAIGFKIEMPSNEAGEVLRWRDFAVIGPLTAIGFTVSLFVVAAGGGPDSLRLGAMMSPLFGVVAFVASQINKGIDKHQGHNHGNDKPLLAAAAT